jgi:hypothetical protein
MRFRATICDTIPRYVSPKSCRPEDAKQRLLGSYLATIERIAAPFLGTPGKNRCTLYRGTRKLNAGAALV